MLEGLFDPNTTSFLRKLEDARRSKDTFGRGWNDDIDPEDCPNSYRRCAKCGHVRLLMAFPLINDDDPDDCRRHKLCRVCMGNRLWRAQQLRQAHTRRRAKNLAETRAYQLRLSYAMPAWADKQEIERFYIEARALTVSTRTKHQVDHIVPLKHPLVCGLHVPANLRVITASSNFRKSNRFLVLS